MAKRCSHCGFRIRGSVEAHEAGVIHQRAWQGSAFVRGSVAWKEARSKKLPKVKSA